MSHRQSGRRKHRFITQLSEKKTNADDPNRMPSIISKLIVFFIPMKCPDRKGKKADGRKNINISRRKPHSNQAPKGDSYQKNSCCGPQDSKKNISQTIPGRVGQGDKLGSVAHLGPKG